MKKNETAAELERRTAEFGLITLRMMREMPTGVEFKNIRRRLTHSATAVGAAYRESNLAETRIDHINRLSVVRRELALTEYLLDLIAGLKPDIPAVGMIREEAKMLAETFETIYQKAKKDRDEDGLADK